MIQAEKGLTFIKFLCQVKIYFSRIPIKSSSGFPKTYINSKQGQGVSAFNDQSPQVEREGPVIMQQLSLGLVLVSAPCTSTV